MGTISKIKNKNFRARIRRGVYKTNALTKTFSSRVDAKKLLDSKNIKISRSLVGNYCTSLEMQGASITLTKLDEEIAKHWDSKVHTAAMRWGM